VSDPDRPELRIARISNADAHDTDMASQSAGTIKFCFRSSTSVRETKSSPRAMKGEGAADSVGVALPANTAS
jgi:hypothetical protein